MWLLIGLPLLAMHLLIEIVCILLFVPVYVVCLAVCMTHDYSPLVERIDP